MSAIRTKAERPARTYATGAVTKGLRWLGVLATLGITAWILVRYPSLPDTVATHFDVRGQADDWGPRWSILALGGIMALMALALAVLSTRPRGFNYPVAITADNAQAVYREGERMMVWTLLGVVGLYGGIAWATLATGGAPLLAVSLVGLIGASLLGIVRMVRAAR